MGVFNYNKVTSITFNELKKIVGADFITTDKEQLEKYGHDETEDFIFLAEIVVKPQTVEQVAAITKVCNLNKIPLTTRGAGTGLSGGALPVMGGVLLSTEKFNKILNIDERVTASPLGNEERKLLVGITVGMNRFEFDIFMDSYGTNFTLVQQHAIFHPWQLTFRNSRRQHVLVMTWSDYTASSTVVEFSTRPLRLK